MTLQLNAFLCAIFLLRAAGFASDLLPSWVDGPAKRSIVSFVERVTTEGSEDFVPPAERIAVFDNDGTLWCEYPVPNQAAFAFDEILRMLPGNPTWQDDPAVQAVKAGDMSTLLADHHKGLLRILSLTHAGMTTDEFDSRVDQWLASARHPRFQRPYTETIYQPMLELLEYLRARSFQTWIVSGGGQDFMRVFAEDTYGIPPQQVIGSHGRLTYQLQDGVPTLIKTLDTLFIDDKAGKPVGIAQFIGRRPIACFGNSDGDQAMLEYTTVNNPRLSFGLIVHHTDAEREYAYDAHPPGSGRLTTALEVAPDRGWTVVNMKEDWKQIFPPAGKATINAHKLTFGRLMTTRRAGPPHLMQQEQQLSQALPSVSRFHLDDRGGLELQSDDGTVVVRLRATDPQPAQKSQPAP